MSMPVSLRGTLLICARSVPCLLNIIAVTVLVAAMGCSQHPASDAPAGGTRGTRTFSVTGVVERVATDAKTMLIKHEAVPDYMAAMSMPFNVKDAKEIAGLGPGDAIVFRLHVTQEESWIDRVTRTQSAPSANPQPVQPAVSTNSSTTFQLAQIPEFALTNEFGARVDLHQFQGRALALTFFFTRCPIPEFCPRLSRNFAEASAALERTANGPTNWHFLSISFDPLDTPAALRAYAQQYHYDSNHWSFVTGDPDHIRSLTRGFGLLVTPENGLLSHDFRTAIFDASGRLQTMWPFGGNMAEMLAKEVVKACAATNGS